MIRRFARGIPPGQSSEVGPYLVSNWSPGYLTAVFEPGNGVHIERAYTGARASYSIAQVREDPSTCPITGGGHHWSSKGWPVVVCVECPQRAELVPLPPPPPPTPYVFPKLPVLGARA